MSLDLREEVALKPCPVCRGAAKLSRLLSPAGIARGDAPSYDIECSECWVHGRWNTQADAVAAWNRRAPDPQLSDLTVRIAELEAGVSKIARGDVPPEKEGHYLAHREAVRIARALLSPAVEGGGGERNMASRELSTTTNAAPSASGLADPTSSGAE